MTDKHLLLLGKERETHTQCYFEVSEYVEFSYILIMYTQTAQLKGIQHYSSHAFFLRIYMYAIYSKISILMESAKCWIFPDPVTYMYTIITCTCIYRYIISTSHIHCSLPQNFNPFHSVHLCRSVPHHVWISGCGLPGALRQ